MNYYEVRGANLDRLEQRRRLRISELERAAQVHARGLEAVAARAGQLASVRTWFGQWRLERAVQAEVRREMGDLLSPLVAELIRLLIPIIVQWLLDQLRQPRGLFASPAALETTLQQWGEEARRHR